MDFFAIQCYEFKFRFTRETINKNLIESTEIDRKWIDTFFYGESIVPAKKYIKKHEKIIAKGRSVLLVLF